MSTRRYRASARRVGHGHALGLDPFDYLHPLEFLSLAIRVLRDVATGQDVTDEYVDLQSRLTNLEATAARIRESLDDAKTVEEALKVNAQLTDMEAEIEQVKGRMNYVRDRSAYSTITVDIEPQVPTPTPSLLQRRAQSPRRCPSSQARRLRMRPVPWST